MDWNVQKPGWLKCDKKDITAKLLKSVQLQAGRQANNKIITLVQSLSSYAIQILSELPILLEGIIIDQ